MQHFLPVGHVTNFRHLPGPHEKFIFFMYTMNHSVWGKSVLARAILNGLAGRIVARGPPVAHLCFSTLLRKPTNLCAIQQTLLFRIQRFTKLGKKSILNKSRFYGVHHLNCTIGKALEARSIDHGTHDHVWIFLEGVGTNASFHGSKHLLFHLSPAC